VNSSAHLQDDKNIKTISTIFFRQKIRKIAYIRNGKDYTSNIQIGIT